ASSTCSATITSAPPPKRCGCGGASARSRGRSQDGADVAIVALGRNGTTPGVAVVEGPRRGLRILLAVASGVLLAAAFPPVDVEFLAWIALVPLLLAARGLPPGRAFGIGWLGGATFFAAIVYWVTYTISAYSAVPAVLAVLICVLMVSILACYTGVFVAGLVWLDAHDLPIVWLAAPLWVTLEWMRSWFVIGFPWASLGYSQYRYHDLVQMAEVTGVYGVSAVLVFFNVVVF